MAARPPPASEHELVAQFGMARMTVNRALRELVEQGRIVRVAGVGSFVAENKPQSTLLQIANIASEIRARGHDYGYRLVSGERVAASADVAAWLDLRAGESVFHSVCLHLEDGVPVRMMLDTGATLVSIPASMADRMGID